LNFSHELACLVHSQRYLFVRVLAKNFESNDLVNIEDVLLGNSEPSVRIMGLMSFLLHHCIAMQAIWFEILKHDKIWGVQFSLQI